MTLYNYISVATQVALQSEAHFFAVSDLLLKESFTPVMGFRLKESREKNRKKTYLR
jgi:hypothetical protein